MSSPIYGPPEPKSRAASADAEAQTQAMNALLVPLAQLAVAKGMPCAAVEGLLRQVFVRAVRDSHPNLPSHLMVSRIATATGLSRREVTRLSQAVAKHPRRRPPSAEVFACWASNTRFHDARGRPRKLPRQGDAPSFKTLAQSVTRDAHARSLLGGDVINLIPIRRAPALMRQSGLANATMGRIASVDVLSYASTAAPRVHVFGDASATTQLKAGHIADQQAKVCADALSRIFSAGAPDPAPVINSACFSIITMSNASWLQAVFQYSPQLRAMQAVPPASGAATGWNGDHFEDMTQWLGALMTDSFA